jgi:ribulose kinase
MAHYIGLDVGTGSSRACLINEKGDILSVAVKDIQTWHEKADYYVRSRTELNGLTNRNNQQRIYGPHAVMLRSRL